MSKSNVRDWEAVSNAFWLEVVFCRIFWSYKGKHEGIAKHMNKTKFVTHLDNLHTSICECVGELFHILALKYNSALKLILSLQDFA
jgi:hypothetical protein